MNGSLDQDEGENGHPAGGIRPSLSLLGSFELKGRAQVPIPTKKNRAILAILALSPAGRCTRERLCALLWGDRDEEQARASLRQSLAVLRKELADFSSLVATKDDTVELSLDKLDVDVLTLRKMGGGASLTGDVAAAKAYQGELLADVAIREEGFEEWLSSERRALADLAVQILDRLSRTAPALERVPYARRLVELDPLREASHRALMRAHRDAGESAMAMRQFEVCRRILKEELGIEPAPATRDLYVELANSGAATTASVEAAFTDSPPSILSRDVDANRPRIAVLPFTNLSGDLAQEYLSDGITEDIITELSRFRNLFVIARNTSFTYKGRALNVTEVGHELGVGFVVEGSVRRLGGRIRTTAQLVNTTSGSQIWAERYDRPFEDLFEMQDEVVSSIAATVEGRLASEVAERASVKRKNVFAYELVLQARQLMGTYDVEAAEPLLRKALALDPKYAQAQAWLAWVYMIQFYSDLNVNTINEAVAVGRMSVELDPNDALCHAVLGCVYLFAQRFELADVQTRRALEINPVDGLAISIRAQVLCRIGHVEEALRTLEGVLRRDPYPPNWYWENLAIALMTSRRYKEAIEAINSKSRIFSWDHYFLGVCYTYLGKNSEAESEIVALRKLRPTLTIQQVMLAEPYKNNVDAQHLIDGLRSAGLPE